MKLSFSTANVKTASFLELCDTAMGYGFNSIELYDLDDAKNTFKDGLFSSLSRADAKRKLVNRHIEVSALTYPVDLSSGLADAKAICEYVNAAADAGIKNVIVSLVRKISSDDLKEILYPAVKEAEKEGVRVLVDSVGDYADTTKLVKVFRKFASPAMGACWNVRETYFNAKESAEDTITNLGAYIGYVRLGDMKDGKNVLIGEGDLPVGEVLDALRSLNFDGAC